LEDLKVNETEIVCFFCEAHHEIPRHGFEVYQELKDMIDSRSHLYDDEKKIKAEINDSIEDLMNGLSQHGLNFDDILNNFKSEIRNEIETSASELKASVDEIKNKMLADLVKFEETVSKLRESGEYSNIALSNNFVHRLISRWNEFNRSPDLRNEPNESIKMAIQHKTKEIEQNCNLIKTASAILSSFRAKFNIRNFFPLKKYDYDAIMAEMNSTDRDQAYQNKQQLFKLVIGTAENEIKFWDLEKSKCLASFANGIKKDVGILSMVAYKESVLITGCRDGAIRFWEICLLNTNKFNTLPKQSNCGGVFSLVVAKEHHLICGYESGAIKIWDLNNYACLRTLHNAHSSEVYTLLSLSNDGLISCSGDGFIKFWHVDKLNPSSGECRIRINNKSSVFAILNYDNKYLVSGSDDGLVKIWVHFLRIV
jgi:WD40 repeat protein